MDRIKKLLGNEKMKKFIIPISVIIVVMSLILFGIAVNKQSAETIINMNELVLMMNENNPPIKSFHLKPNTFEVKTTPDTKKKSAVIDITTYVIPIAETMDFDAIMNMLVRLGAHEEQFAKIEWNNERSQGFAYLFGKYGSYLLYIIIGLVILYSIKKRGSLPIHGYKTKLFSKEKSTTTFKDVAGVEDAKNRSRRNCRVSKKP